jgi:hypothetical protein
MILNKGLKRFILVMMFGFMVDTRNSIKYYIWLYTDQTVKYDVYGKDVTNLLLQMIQTTMISGVIVIVEIVVSKLKYISLHQS